ncbi:MAG: hypothetical protein JXR53_07450, partial [Bacteroidales bacterium]|nr:hypothetical protein [Bacteroidales bacterium]
MQKLNRRILLFSILMLVGVSLTLSVYIRENSERISAVSVSNHSIFFIESSDFDRNFDNSSQNSEEILPDYIYQRQKWEMFLANHPYSQTEHKTDEEWKELPKADRPDMAMQLDFFKTVDPALGEVPYERLAIAAKQMQEMIDKNKAAISGVSWLERGPNNVGGRSRALMFDPNDVTNKKVWAGGVGGGLWYTNDITAASPTWTKVNDLWSNISISTIAYNPANTQEFYVGTGEGWYNGGAQRGAGIWKSSDGGATWVQLAATDPGAYNSGSNFHYVQKIVVKPNGTIIAACRGYFINRGGILRSTDGGNTWAQVLSVYTGAGTLYDRAADVEIAANGDLYSSFGCFSQGKIYKSTNANDGALGTWVDITPSPAANEQRIEIACAPSNSNVIYAVAHGGSGDNDVEWFKKSTNGGSSWADITTPQMIDGSGDDFTRAQAWYDLILAVHPTNPNLVIVGGIDLHRTTDGGTTWTGISHWYGGYGEPEVHADQHAIVFRPGSSNELVFGNDGGIYYSSDAGNSAANPSFSNKNTGYNVTQFYACATKNEVNSHYFLSGAQDNGSQQFTQPGMNSTTEVTGGDGAFCHIDQVNPDIQITSYVYNTVFRSLDGGNTFPQITSNTTGHFINPSDYDSQRKILYSADSDNRLRRISNIDGSPTNGTMTITIGSVGSAQISTLKVSPYNDVVFLGVENGRIYKLTNASTGSPTLTRIDNGTIPITASGWVSSIDVGANDNQLLVTYSNYGVASVWETTDGGTNWYDKEGNLPDMPVRWAIYNPNDRNDVLCATELGVWSTDNFQPGTSNAPTYGPSNIGLANTRCDMLELRPIDNVVVVATHGRGLFTTDIFATSQVADFGVDQTYSCTGSLTVQFIDASLNPNGDWAWDIDDNSTTDYTTQNPSHTYNADGLYSVKLDIDGGAASITKNNLILVQSSSPTACTTCTFLATSNPGNGFGIGVSYFGLENISNSTSYNDAQYSDYSCSYFTNLDLNTMYNISVTTGTANPEGARVYIDYDDDGDLEASEAVVSFPSNTAGFRTLSFTTPASGVVLNKGLRMRVVSSFGGVPATPCSTGTYGQAEDYTVYFYDASTLPVELVSFTSECSENGTLLSWSTASEQNNMGFEVERSTDLKNWITISKIQGAGNSNQIVDYSFTDLEGVGSLYYYRLKQIDFNGKYAYSNVIESDCISFEGLSEIVILPNPVADNLNVKLSVALDESAIVYIQDMYGKTVLQEEADLLRGENQLQYDV